MNLFGEKKLALWLALVAALALALAGCGDDKAASGDESASSDGACETAEIPAPKDVKLSKPTEQLDPDKTYTIAFETSCGDFTVELDVKNNPKTASSMFHIAQEGLYDGTWFHRIVPDFVIQGGDPLGTGTGDAGYKVKEEPTGEYALGTVAMAKGGDEPPGTSSSQFFVTTGAQGVALPSEYAIAGNVISGQDVVDSIAAFADPNDTTGSGKPTEPVVIESATVATK